jgi:hypothetical protein
MCRYKNKAMRENPNLTSQKTLTHISVIDDGIDNKMKDLLRRLE